MNTGFPRHLKITLVPAPSKPTHPSQREHRTASQHGASRVEGYFERAGCHIDTVLLIAGKTTPLVKIVYRMMFLGSGEGDVFSSRPQATNLRAVASTLPPLLLILFCRRIKCSENTQTGRKTRFFAKTTATQHDSTHMDTRHYTFALPRCCYTTSSIITPSFPFRLVSTAYSRPPISTLLLP